MQPGEGAVERQAAVGAVDFLAGLFERLQVEDLAQEEFERAGDVVLQGSRAEDTLGAERSLDFRDDGRVAQESVIGSVLAAMEAGAH